MLLADSGTKIVSMVRNRSIRVVKIVVNNTNFDSFLVVKKVLCASICILIGMKTVHNVHYN